MPDNKQAPHHGPREELVCLALQAPADSMRALAGIAERTAARAAHASGGEEIASNARSHARRVRAWVEKLGRATDALAEEHRERGEGADAA